VDLEAARAKLIEHLRREIRDQRVLDVMEHIPRELFTPHTHRNLAYEDIPLPIGAGQTISQPFIIALMTEAMELSGEEKVLEIGTGSGYQAAILAELAKKVITVERHRQLARRAKLLLKKLGYANVEVYLAGKALGWSPAAPYDAIMVTAGAPQVPQQLLDQLAPGGRLVIPVGSQFEQDLLKVVKGKRGITTENLGACRFVSLIGEGAWKE
jgi:protein-L-isoaspartate(D-aspartate) O-methyltransferase